MNIRPIRFIIVIIILTLLLVIVNIVANQVMFNTKMSAGSHIYLGPLVFSKETYTNSVLNEKSFNLLNLIINIIIIIAIAIILSIKFNNKK